MGTDENTLGENVDELRKRVENEQDLEKLLELVSKLKSLIDARFQRKL